MKPIIDQATLARYNAAHAAGHPDAVEVIETDWPIRLKCDYPDLRLPKGTEIVVRMGEFPKDGDVAVVKIGRDLVLRRAPAPDGPGDGKVVGRMLGVVREVPDVG